jgi:hypothetical protein
MRTHPACHRGVEKKNPDCMILLTNFKDAVEGCFDIDGYATLNSRPCGEFIDLDYAYEKDFETYR